MEGIKMADSLKHLNKTLILIIFLILLPVSRVYGFSHKYDMYFRQYASVYMPILNWHWFKAQAIQESGISESARSWVGAIGVMQLMPFTATGLKVNAYSARENIKGGIIYDNEMYSIFRNEKGMHRVKFMFGAYNTGAGNIILAQNLCQENNIRTDLWQSIVCALPHITGRSASRQTIDYVIYIFRYYKLLII